MAGLAGTHKISDPLEGRINTLGIEDLYDLVTPLLSSFSRYRVRRHSSPLTLREMYMYRGEKVKERLSGFNTHHAPLPCCPPSRVRYR